MSSDELHHMAVFYEALAGKFALTDDIALWRDISESPHVLAREPGGVTYEETDANGVPALWAIPNDADADHVLLHSHGGGGVVSSMWTDRKAVAHLAKATGARALIVNYRLAPEHRFPAQLDDVVTAYRWLLARGYDPASIASIGHSIGGNFAVNLALTVKGQGEPLPGAVLSMSPWFDIALTHESIDRNEALDKILSRKRLTGFADAMLDGTGIGRTDPRINIEHADLTGLPPTFVYYGDQEILTDDAEAFARRARAAGVDLELRVLPDGQHNLLLGAGRVPEIDLAVIEMSTWLRATLGIPAA